MLTLAHRAENRMIFARGVVLAARSISRRSGRSVLHGRTTTALTWSLERSAWNLTRFWGRLWDRDYYPPSADLHGEPAGYLRAQQEAARALAAPDDFVAVSSGSPTRRRPPYRPYHRPEEGSDRRV